MPTSKKGISQNSDRATLKAEVIAKGYSVAEATKLSNRVPA